MKIDFVHSPVITGEFKAKFYWTGNSFEDAERINRPHIKKEGVDEDRITATLDILNDLSNWDSFTLNDALNIQNRLLKENNWRGIKSGLRDHNINFKDSPIPMRIPMLIDELFPVSVMDKDSLLEWYTQIQLVHPLSDLNGRVFGIIVSILNQHNIKK